MRPTPNLLKLICVAAVLVILSACSKKQDATPDNIAAYHKDASQAQTLDLTSVNSNMVLEDRVDGVDYIVSHNITVLANLTIKPGVTIMFADGAGITVRQTGSLTAIGTGKNLIYFTSQSGKRGAWNGITFIDDNAKNVLSFCNIEHGGSATNEFGSGDVIVGSGSIVGQTEISNCEITASNTDGIVIAEGSNVLSFYNNSINTNTAYPINMNIADIATVGATNTYANNGSEFIKLNGSGSLIVKEISLIKLNEPFLISGRVVAGSSFSIRGGNHISIDSGTEIIIDGVDGNGSFSAIGSQAQPITLAPVYGGSGVWNRIKFRSSSSANNIMQYCTISGGGAGSGDGMISVVNENGGSSKIAIRNCTISNSTASGIYIEGSGTQYNTDILTANTFSNNAKGNVQIK